MIPAQNIYKSIITLAVVFFTSLSSLTAQQVGICGEVKGTDNLFKFAAGLEAYYSVPLSPRFDIKGSAAYEFFMYRKVTQSHIGNGAMLIADETEGRASMPTIGLQGLYEITRWSDRFRLTGGLGVDIHMFWGFPSLNTFKLYERIELQVPFTVHYSGNPKNNYGLYWSLIFGRMFRSDDHINIEPELGKHVNMISLQFGLFFDWTNL